jgi:UDP-2,3-diacylglucosamine hydrolase
MSSSTTKRLGLVAGEGTLPLEVAKGALAAGWELVAYPLFKDNVEALKRCCKTVRPTVAGLMGKNFAQFKADNLQGMVFAGKVNKWLLLLNPQMDERARQWLTQLVFRNDDAIMLSIIDELAKEGIVILPQTQFLRHLFQPQTILSQQEPTAAQWRDIQFGFPLAQASAGLDFGQTVVVHEGMVLAVEAIEGTDECLKRAGSLARKKGGVVLKVAKPMQDQRFDVPTVGVRTLKTMKEHGLKVLATEAMQTLLVDLPAMQTYANKHGLALVSVASGQTPSFLQQEPLTTENALIKIK